MFKNKKDCKGVPHGKSGKNRKRVVIGGIVLSVALLHFVTGKKYGGPYPGFVNGYLLDILVPFSFYFLFCVIESSLLRTWFVKGALVLGTSSFVEIAQFFGVPLFGRTFDPMDFFMYGVGIMAAILLDTVVFVRVFRFWNLNAPGST
jgi:hypothetical protein